ncbi:helix-hairpin-helix domain-containing protein [Xanthomonas sp. WHRI 1810A]|uniref:ComEA family DNA-binding protein n=1 Tax=Xanthomonas sp. WHRI 1810A TaxID=3161565 RepID=UPI0032E872C1
MRTSLLSSLAFALLTSFSVAATAAPMAQPPSTPPAAVQPAEQGAKVNLNTATAETLQKELSGIGAGKASAIVAYRDENGSFTSIDELIEVKGIGKAILDKNRDKLSIE